MLDKLRWTLQNFMNGRNGNDDLNRALFAVAVIAYIVSLFVKRPWLSALTLVLFIVVLVRSLSRNLAQRQRENDWFTGQIQLIRLRWELRKEYKVFRCRRCGRNIRVPRHRGRIEVTCPSCREVKIMYTGKRK